jgi:hypothetical protein
MIIFLVGLILGIALGVGGVFAWVYMTTDDDWPDFSEHGGRLA